jgi:hypothetical protein
LTSTTESSVGSSATTRVVQQGGFVEPQDETLMEQERRSQSVPATTAANVGASAVRKAAARGFWKPCTTGNATSAST